MLNKRLPFKAPVPTPTSHSKQLDNSLSTEQSPREYLASSKHNKQKSQLCKRFMESDYCSYDRRCKFAHGLAELKKNDHANGRYKTRPCGCYLQEGFCPFGDRCNFIHPHQPAQQAPIRHMDIDFVVIKTGTINKSRLLGLLGKKEI